MSKKLVLDYEEELNYTIIAVSSTLADYRLLFFLNKTLLTNFKRLEEFYVNTKNQNYSTYYFSDEANDTELYFLSNKSNGITLFNELQMFDFLILISGSQDEDYCKKLNDSIRKVNHVQISKIVDTAKIKNYLEIMYEFENHIHQGKKNIE